jgi:beta-galactosidase
MSDVTNQSRLSRLDLDWRFHLGDIDAPLPNTHVAAYMANKAGYARGAAKPNYDDSDWRMVELRTIGPSREVRSIQPHGRRLPAARHRWYRRRFRLDEIRSRQVSRHPIRRCRQPLHRLREWSLLHRNFCGYTPFTIDISDIATFGDDLNVIALARRCHADGRVVVRGGGIYRHTWLVKASKLHVAPDGVFVRPERTSSGGWDTWIDVEVGKPFRRRDQVRRYQRDSGSDGGSWCGVTNRSSASKVTAVRRDCLPVTKPALWSSAVATPVCAANEAAGRGSRRRRCDYVRIPDVRFDAK